MSTATNILVNIGAPLLGTIIGGGITFYVFKRKQLVQKHEIEPYQKYLKQCASIYALLKEKASLLTNEVDLMDSLTIQFQEMSNEIRTKWANLQVSYRLSSRNNEDRMLSENFFDELSGSLLLLSNSMTEDGFEISVNRRAKAFKIAEELLECQLEEELHEPSIQSNLDGIREKFSEE
jgi:hypothetical protein